MIREVMLRTNKADVAAVHLKRKTVHFATACLSASFAANREGERATTQKSASTNVMTPNETRRLPLPANPHGLNPYALFLNAVVGKQSLRQRFTRICKMQCTQPFNCITDRDPSAGSERQPSSGQDGAADKVAAMIF